MTTLKFDHAILVVDDLKQAQIDFEALGFTVFYGGKHADGNTENCLIVFKDSSYIELIGLVNQSALNDPNGMHAKLFNPGEGWTGYALLSQNLEEDVRAISARGLTLVGPGDNSRKRPDGELVAWRAASVDDTMNPFFLQDRTPRNLRVPNDERADHTNGVTGIARVVVAVPALEVAIKQYTALLDQTPIDSTWRRRDSQAVDFTIDETTLTLAMPTSKDSALNAHLNKRGGSCLFAMYLRSNTYPLWELPSSRLHSANMALIKDS